MNKCPACKQLFESRADDTCFPFCSERCRLIDLGSWLNEENRIPAEEAATERPDTPIRH